MSLQVILNFKNQVVRDSFLTKLKDNPDVEVKELEEIIDLKLIEKATKSKKGLTLAQIKKQYGL